MEPEDFEQRERDKEPLTLRDTLAAAALTGLLANSSEAPFTSIVDWAYKYADALLKARTKTKETPT